MRLSKAERQVAEIVERAAAGVAESWNLDLSVGAEVKVQRGKDVA